MNIISDTQIVLHISPNVEVYAKEVQNIFKPVLKQNAKYFKLNTIICCLVCIIGFIMASFYAREIRELLPYSYANLGSKLFLSISIAFTSIIICWCVRQILLYQYFFKNIEYLKNNGVIFANEHFIQFTYANNAIKLEYNWQFIADVYQNNQKFIVINMAKGDFTLIPPETFENDEQRQQVFEQLTTWQQAKQAITN